MSITAEELKILSINHNNFTQAAVGLFQYQYTNVPIYRQYVDLLGVDVSMVKEITDIPFLPIQFFKTHTVYDASQDTPKLIFESSGTTQQVSSKHRIANTDLYEISFMKTFEMYFGPVEDYCILGLLPSYLEKGNSSLVYMVQHLIDRSKHKSSGFFLHNMEALAQTLAVLEMNKQKSILFGVSYALLDFAKDYSMTLQSTKIIETGGMKGRKKEMQKHEFYRTIKQAFGISSVASEYGMTELLSQAYSMDNGIYSSPPWMRVLVRDMYDVKNISMHGKGGLNIIDLANQYSCSFIATDDVGEVYENNTFQVIGRLDNSDIRGCNLLLI